MPVDTGVQLGAGILLLLGAVSYFTNILVNLIRMYAKLDLWVVIALLLVGGPFISLLFWLAGDPNNSPQSITWSNGSMIILGGWAGVGGALGANAVQSAALPTKPPTDATK